MIGGPWLIATAYKMYKPTKQQMRRFRFEYARDYALTVFERYEKRFGCLDRVRAARQLEKIMKRWRWFNSAHLRMPRDFYDRKIPQFADGKYCPIGFVGYLDGGWPVLEQCESCGAPVVLAKGTVIDPLIRGNGELREYPAWGWGVVECTNKLCNEAHEFMRGKHHLLDAAKKIQVAAKRPLSAYRNAPAKLKGIIAAAALLDFEARYAARKDAITNV